MQPAFDFVCFPSLAYRFRCGRYLHDIAVVSLDGSAYSGDADPMVAATALSGV